MGSETGVGVDWASGVWIAVEMDEDGVPRASLEDSFQEVASKYEEPRRIVADVPIGLCSGSKDSDCDCRCEHDEGECSRPVDTVARAKVGDRSSSVFTPPCREVAHMKADEKPYDQANTRNKELTGKGLQQQAYHISEGIAQVDSYLCENEGERDRILEGHPEVCFAAFADWKGLEYSKKTALGIHERVSLLADAFEFGAGELIDVLDEVVSDGTDGNLPDGATELDLDDILDACALAFTALDNGEPDWFSTRGDEEDEQPLRDEKGLPMQMVFREP